MKTEGIPTSFSSRNDARRRGMLLLLVLLMLTIFLGLGLLAIASATRSRQTARAYANATSAASVDSVTARSLLDQVLMKLLRGPSSPGSVSDVPESILEDMYCGDRDLNRTRGYAKDADPPVDDAAEDVTKDGAFAISDSIIGTLQAVGATSGPLTEVTITLATEGNLSDSAGLWDARQDLNSNGMYDPPPPSPLALNGRVITFVPLPGQSFSTTSYRIIRTIGSATAGTYRCLIADLHRGSEKPIPVQPPRQPVATSTLPLAKCDVVINGPAFRVEPHDRPDEPWIAALQGSAVDNDNDGTFDGKWLANVLPVIQATNGKTYRCDVSIKVDDLDSKINVNAHGASRRNASGGKTAQLSPYAAATNYATTNRLVPIGSGWGPADIDANLVIGSHRTAGTGTTETLWQVSPSEPAAAWVTLLFGDADNPATYPLPVDASQRRPAPVVGALVGRYGGIQDFTATPGLPGAVADPELQPAKANSPSDLKSRMKVFTQPPYSAVATGSASGATTLVFFSPDTDDDTINDPYEMRLDRDAPRTGEQRGGATADAPFTVAELERVLRPYDTDTSNLPSRLAALLGARLTEDKNGNAVLDSAEPKKPKNDPDNPKPIHDGEDKEAVTNDGKILKPNGILDSGEDANENGLLDRAYDLNGNGHADVAEDLITNNRIDRFWPNEVETVLAETRLPLTEDEKQTVRNWAKNRSELLRTLITTDSWDTPGLVGKAAQTLQTNLLTLGNAPTAYTSPNVVDAGAYNFMSPDVISGLKFDINRSINTVAQQREYCKHLYTLAYAFYHPTLNTLPSSAEAARWAQWAANVADFRDADSKITIFEYDTDLRNGWDVDGDPTTDEPTKAVVYGLERPELLITESVAWQEGTSGQLAILLYRPWSAVHKKYDRSTDTPAVKTYAAEQLAPELAADTFDVTDRNRNGAADDRLLNLQKRAPDNSPVWRIRIQAAGGTAKTIRFDDLTGLADAQKAVTCGSTAANTPDVQKAVRLPPNSYLCIKPSQPLQYKAAAPQPSDDLTDFIIDTPECPLLAQQNDLLFLDRLADPTQAYNGKTNPYVCVDQVQLAVQKPSAPDGNAGDNPNDNAFKVVYKRVHRNQYSAPQPPATSLTPAIPLAKSFWRTNEVTSPTSGALARLDYEAPWLHFPNRPFISAAELLCVPDQGPLPVEETNAGGSFWRNYSPYDPKDLAWATGWSAGSTSSFAKKIALLDLIHVPSRFPSNTVVVPQPEMYLTNVGMAGFARAELSKWREPGRVNLNLVNSQQIKQAVRGPLSTLASAAAPKPANLPTTTADLVTNELDPYQQGSFDDVLQSASLQSLTLTTYRPFEGSRNPFFALSTAIRLSNLATTRSHVFAIWITIRLTDQDDPTSIKDYRMFAIVDRSVPVGFIHGRDLNVRDMIVLQRFLD